MKSWVKLSDMEQQNSLWTMSQFWHYLEDSFPKILKFHHFCEGEEKAQKICVKMAESAITHKQTEEDLKKDEHNHSSSESHRFETE